MNKKLKILIGIVVVIFALYLVIFFIDYNRCANLKEPIFAITVKEDDSTNKTIEYQGLGYNVIVNKDVAQNQIVKVEMYMFNKCIAGSITDIDNDNSKLPYITSKEKGIATVLTLEDEVTEDTIWCGTFQLIWNDLKNDLAKQDIIFSPQLKVVENLNKETFTVNDLSDKYYYKKYGTPSLELKEEIERAIKQKFNEKSDILDSFEWNNNPKDYFLYAMLKKEFEFEKTFEELEKGKFANYDNVTYFGIKKDSENEEIRKQVQVLYYNSKDDFGIKLKTKQEDEVILCKKPEGNTFNQIYQNILSKATSYKKEKYFKEGELLKIPNIKLKEKNEFTELQNKTFFFSNGDEYEIEKAVQTIEFELDKTGGKIKSEAGMSVENAAAIRDDEIREFALDDTFAIFLIEGGKNNPYFAGKINNITKFQ